MTTNVYTFDGFCNRAVNATSVNELRDVTCAYLRDSVEGEAIVDDAQTDSGPYRNIVRIVANRVIERIENPVDED